MGLIRRLPRSTRRALEPEPSESLDAPWVVSSEIKTRTFRIITDARTILMPTEVPRFDRGRWQQVQQFIRQEETVRAPARWAEFRKARALWQKKTAETYTTQAFLAYMRWLRTQRFVLAGIRPGMSPEALYTTVVAAVAGKKLLLECKADRGLATPLLKKMRRRMAPTLASLENSEEHLGLLSQSTKTEKSRVKLGIATSVMYLSPFMEAGINVCGGASPGCSSTCITTAGQLRGALQQSRRIRRTLHFVLFRQSFVQQLVQEIDSKARKAVIDGEEFVVRLNGSSDIAWEHPSNGAIMSIYPHLLFYSYTKLPFSVRAGAVEANLRGYTAQHIVFSYSERAGALAESLRYLSNGGNVALVVGAEGVFSDTEAHVEAALALVAQANRYGLMGFKAINGDEHDARFRDPPGTWVILHSKGLPAAQDTTGFVLRVDRHGVPVSGSGFCPAARGARVRTERALQINARYTRPRATCRAGSRQSTRAPARTKCRGPHALV